MLDVTLLGTAALAPTPERALAAATVSFGGRTVLFDCGEGTQVAARRAGVSLMKADLIALTHYHGDHIFGLPGLLQTMSCLSRTDPLCITGPVGLEDAMAPIFQLAGKLNYAVRLIPTPPEGLALDTLNRAWGGAVRLTRFETVHRVPSQGYRLTLERAGRFLPEAARALGVPVEHWSRLQRGETVAGVRPGQVLGPARRGLSVVFSGDTAPCEALVEAARGADLVICEATYAEDAQAEPANAYGHMTFAQAAGIARNAGARRLWLTHFSQMIEDPAAALPIATAFFPEAVCGEDGLRTTLRFEA